MYSSTLSLTSALDGVGGQRHDSAALHAGKTRWWGPGPIWTGVKFLALPPGLDPRTVQPVASRYTDCPIPAR